MSGTWGLTRLICSIVVLALVSCSKASDDAEKSHAPVTGHPRDKVSGVPPSSTEEMSWLPTSVKLTCGVHEGCLPQVGVLLFGIPRKDGKVEVHRCTAFLIEPGDRVATAGHCDYSNFAQGYFVSRSDLEYPFWRKVSLLNKLHTPDPKFPDLLSGKPDVAVFQLSSKVTTLRPLPVAAGPGRAYRQLTGFVVNRVPGKSALTLVVQKLSCIIRRNERYFPFSLEEKPDIITAYECAGNGGNSGGPMFGENSWAVEAVFNGTKDLKAFAEMVREKENRNLYPFEKHNNIEATNLRCVDLQTGRALPCTEASDREVHRRFENVQAASVASMRSRVLSFPLSYDFEFRNEVYYLKEKESSGALRFETLYFPICRRYDVNQVAMPMELSRMDFDEWGRPIVSVLRSYNSIGQIRGRQGNNFRLDVQWAPAPGPYLRPEKNPREALGNSFSIALPLCTR